MSSHQLGLVHRSLRCATTEAHHSLDHHPLMKRLTGNSLTREQYAESLAAMYQPQSRLERLAHGSRHHFGSGLELSARLPQLEADLSEMDRPIPPVSQPPRDLPESRAAWWGRVYVLEGARRGGAVIARRIHATLGDSVPCRFFGEAPSSDKFTGLLAKLERELEDEDELAQAVAGARAAFADYEAGLATFIGVERSRE